MLATADVTDTVTAPFAVGDHGAVGAWLDCGRLHLQHGPIDLVIRAYGESTTVDAATAAACERFGTVLSELCAELRTLRAPVNGTGRRAGSTTAARMYCATDRFRDRDVTPMATVAGAVADEILSVMKRAAPDLDRITVNNGGDIALHLGCNQALCVDVAAVEQQLTEGARQHARIAIRTDDGVGGIASSGWRGRSWSLGIADQVTVLAGDAATADCAATLIANAVDTDSPRVRRAPAVTVDHDTDLGNRLVTLDVAPLRGAEIDAALQRGVDDATTMLTDGRINAALLRLQGAQRIVGRTDMLRTPHPVDIFPVR